MEDVKIDTSCLFEDLHYTVDVDYTNGGDCESYGCDDEGICRCGTIENPHVAGIPCDRLAEKIAPSELFLKYCVERILRHFKPLHDSSNWDIQVEGGYYGEELGEVKLNESVAEILSNILLSLEKATDNERIEAALALEYGFILPTIKNKTWSLEKITLADVELGQTKHASKLNEERIIDYMINDAPIIGIVLESAGKYRVIDGYHRVTAAKKANRNRVVWALVGR